MRAVTYYKHALYAQECNGKYKYKEEKKYVKKNKMELLKTKIQYLT